MREIFTYGSVGGAPGNRCFYLEPDPKHDAVLANILINQTVVTSQKFAGKSAWVR